MTDLSYLGFNFPNTWFGLSEGLNNISRSIRLGIESHYLLLPFPLLIDRFNKCLFNYLNGLTSPMSDKIFQ